MKIEKTTINIDKLSTDVFVLDTLKSSHFTVDNPKLKRLSINLVEAKPAYTLIIKGDEYDSLGQWTDESLNEYIINKFSLIVVYAGG